jgi:hypothetical protein
MSAFCPGPVKTHKRQPAVDTRPLRTFSECFSLSNLGPQQTHHLAAVLKRHDNEMPMKRFLTPQEKKVLRYEKDRRNTYAESRALSRKAIATRKALASRSLRHAQNVATTKSAVMLDAADPVVRKTGKNSWRKIPDSPLAEYVGRTLKSRSLKGTKVPKPISLLLLKARRNLVPRPKFFKGSISG